MTDKTDEYTEEQASLFADDDTAGNDLLANLDGSDAVTQQWPQTAVEMVDLFNAFMVQHLLKKGQQLTEQNVTTIARQLTVCMARQFGGMQFYMPKIAHLEAHMRDMEIYEAFTGNNIRELARKYDLSEVSIYNIIKRQRAIHLAKIAPRLPGF